MNEDRKLPQLFVGDHLKWKQINALCVRVIMPPDRPGHSLNSLTLNLTIELDGRVTITGSGQLVIRPIAANKVEIAVERLP